MRVPLCLTPWEYLTLAALEDNRPRGRDAIARETERLRPAAPVPEYGVGGALGHLNRHGLVAHWGHIGEWWITPDGLEELARQRQTRLVT